MGGQSSGEPATYSGARQKHPDHPQRRVSVVPVLGWSSLDPRATGRGGHHRPSGDGRERRPRCAGVVYKPRLPEALHRRLSGSTDRFCKSARSGCLLRANGRRGPVTVRRLHARKCNGSLRPGTPRPRPFSPRRAVHALPSRPPLQRRSLPRSWPELLWQKQRRCWPIRSHRRGGRQWPLPHTVTPGRDADQATHAQRHVRVDGSAQHVQRRDGDAQTTGLSRRRSGLSGEVAASEAPRPQ